MRSGRIPQQIDGAPNFRGLPGMPIFGSGMPTIEGIVAVLRVRAKLEWEKRAALTFYNGYRGGKAKRAGVLGSSGVRRVGSGRGWALLRRVKGGGKWDAQLRKAACPPSRASWPCSG